LVPFFALSVGLGPVSSPPRLARTEQLSTIRSQARSGWLRSMPTSMECTCRSTPVCVQSAKRRRKVDPLALASVARRLRHGVPSRRNRRNVASTRTVSVGGWPGPSSRVGSHHSITRAISSKMLSFNAALLVTEQQMGTQLDITTVRLTQPRVVVKTTF